MSLEKKARSNARGRTVLITGATSGIGRSTALALARQGARLLLACRSETRANAVIDQIVRHTGNREVSFVPLDLADLGSVRRCADRVIALGPLHVLINNAGLAGATGVTRDGFEMTVGTNYLGPFLLSLRLLDHLRVSAPARIVNVASRAHEFVKQLDLSAFRGPRRSRLGIAEYSASKLANILFTRSLARRLVGTGVTTYALHPGVVASDLWRNLPRPARGLLNLMLTSSDRGARTTIHCATSPEAANETGQYYTRGRIAQPSALAQDWALADQLWSASTEWVGERGTL